MSRLFDSTSSEPFSLSRSKLELFLECPRCFYLDRCSGIGRVNGYPLSLNLAVDALMKKEFDMYRLSEKPHPVMTMYGVDAVPFRHPKLADWRDTPQGIRALHNPTNIELFGIVDDVWVHPDGKISIVDYKATSTAATITLDDRHGYKRQLEVYQWLFDRNGFLVSTIGYFVFVNGVRDRSMFDRKLEFTMSILPYEGSSTWVEDALIGVKECLMGDIPPPSATECKWCDYRKAAKKIEMSDTEYLMSIPGMVESIKKAAKEPISEGVMEIDL